MSFADRPRHDLVTDRTVGPQRNGNRIYDREGGPCDCHSPCHSKLSRFYQRRLTENL